MTTPSPSVPRPACTTPRSATTRLVATTCSRVPLRWRGLNGCRRRCPPVVLRHGPQLLIDSQSQLAVSKTETAAFGWPFFFAQEIGDRPRFLFSVMLAESLFRQHPPMPRRARITLPGVPLHIIQRGNNRQACFFTDDDYRFYLDQLSQCAQHAGCAVHAYVGNRGQTTVSYFPLN